jgi:ribosomal protein S6--L-glutamate ligase
MILSFHPCFVGDENILCAGRDPNARDLARIQQADAVILPQGCRKSLYEMAAAGCPRVFPDYAARFAFPGKIGQARLFKQARAPFPETHAFLSLSEFQHFNSLTDRRPLLRFPFVFKFDWGGESDNVVRVDSESQFSAMLQRAAEYEKTGQSGFLIQELIPSAGRSLRVVVIGTKRIAYWRAQPDASNFSSGISKGAVIDKTSDPRLRQDGIALVDGFCKRAQINLAGFDIVFSDARKPRGYFLEINYFFGRAGMGGSQRFYDILLQEINRWLNRIGLTSSVKMQ